VNIEKALSDGSAFLVRNLNSKMDEFDMSRKGIIHQNIREFLLQED
jgi:hypothetical protein